MSTQNQRESVLNVTFEYPLGKSRSIYESYDTSSEGASGGSCGGTIAEVVKDLSRSFGFSPPHPVVKITSDISGMVKRRGLDREALSSAELEELKRELQDKNPKIRFYI